jgi:hypothetical protein
MGQNTGMFVNSNMERKKATSVAFITEYQNLNSGSRRIKGRNSSSFLVGSARSSSAVGVDQE